MRLLPKALLCALLCASCFLGLGRGLWTPDEPREAGISREMQEHPGVIPTLNGEPFVEKPPLYYWTTALSFQLAGGPSVVAARSISALSCLLSLALVFVWIARAVSVDRALLASVMLATTVVLVTSAHWVRIDALLLLFYTLSLWSAWERIGRGGGAWWLAAFYAGVVLSLWTKGLIGPVLIAAGLVTYAALSRSLRVLTPLRLVLGPLIVVAALVTLAALILATGGRSALTTWFFVNHVQRFVDPVATGHKASFFYYVWTLPAAALPWLVPFAAVFGFRGALFRRDRADAAFIRFAAAMTFGPLAVLTLSSSKREVYLLPLFPALSLLMATVVHDRIAAGRQERSGRLMRAGEWIQAIILGIVGVAPAAAHAAFTHTVTLASLSLTVLGIAGAAAALVAVARRNPDRAFWMGAGSMSLALIGVFALVVPKVDAIKDMAPFIASVDAALPKGAPVPALGADETLLGIVPFYTGRRVIPIGTGQMPSGPFVLRQSNADDERPHALEAVYEPIASRTFGPSRRMTLWKKREAAP